MRRRTRRRSWAGVSTRSFRKPTTRSCTRCSFRTTSSTSKTWAGASTRCSTGRSRLAVSHGASRAARRRRAAPSPYSNEVKPARFEYHAPRTVEEACALLASLEDAKVLAGGQSLVPLLNFRLARPAHLVDINRIANLDRIYERDRSEERRVGKECRARWGQCQSKKK